jgi:diguanylate cyclase (GGDEF)-like protein/PAS domain S-box-containing protein
MARQTENKQKIPLLIAAVFFFILVSTIGFGVAVAYNTARLQASIQDVYIQLLAVSNTGLDARETLSRLNSHMLKIVLARDPVIIQRLDIEMSALDEKLRKHLSVGKAEFPGDAEKIVEIERLLDELKSMRVQLISLIRQGHRDQASMLATGEGVQIHSQLETKISYVVSLAQHHVATLVDEAKFEASGLIHFVRWFLGGLVVSGAFFGAVVIRKVSTLLERDKQAVSLLHESEERMKLALSGADEGTWDLDVVTGQLNFDAQWGAILGFSSEKDRPHCFEDWSVLIHAEDRERVLKAMQSHIEGWVSEYKADYRIRSSSGTWEWVLGHGRAVSRGHDGKALRIVGVTRDITMKKQAEDRIWQLAHSDSLTGLPNRPLFYDRLAQYVAQAGRHHRKFALLFLDLDGFKQINDKFGHDTGDHLLQEVAERLRQNVRSEDTLARIGGDEFVFILNDVADAGNAALVAQKIIHSLAEPVVIRGNPCRIGGSIGISIFPDDTDDMEALVTQSDDAMYQAKAMGKNNYQFFKKPSAPV